MPPDSEGTNPFPTEDGDGDDEELGDSPYTTETFRSVVYENVRHGLRNGLDADELADELEAVAEDLRRSADSDTDSDADDGEAGG